ncbi:MAG: hypothetical protein JWP00_801 [Chloroflexi bacterium]|jgi:hypothetical protein|nr:hypothetical protein [Chloroflexota bacterium]
MASTTFSPKEQRPETPQQNRPNRPGPKKARSSWRSLLVGLVILASLAGLGALALTSATGGLTGPASSTTLATPAAKTPASASPSAQVTTQAATNTLLNNPFEARPVLYRLAANPADFQVLFAAMADGLRRSPDGGKTWTEVADFKGKNVTALVFDREDSERGIYLGTDQSGLFKSTDSGKTWKNIGLTGRPINLLAATNRNLYVSVAGPRASIYYSTDGGQNFTAPAPNALPANLKVLSLAIDHTNPKNVYIGTAYMTGGDSPDWVRVKFSSDGGKTWGHAGPWGPDKSTGPDPTRPITVLLYASGNYLYAGDGDRLWRLSTDRTTWQPVASGLPTTGVYGLTTDSNVQLSGLVYAATRDGFYRNTDGQSWQKIATGESGPLFGSDPIQLNLAVTPGLVAATTNSAANSVSGLRSTMLYALSSEGRLARYENRDFGTEVVSVVPGASNLPDFTPYGGVNPADKLPPPGETDKDPKKTYIKESGHYLQGDFRDTWFRTDLNGLSIYGYPLTEQFTEYDPRTKTNKIVQYFERVKFEQAKPGDLPRTGLIGYDAIEGRFFPPGRFAVTTDSQQYFDQTKHVLKGAFFTFWNKNGGLSRFGYPITEEFTEKNAQGKDTVYQYFERAKFAFDPDTKTVTISLLGLEVLQKKGWIPK